MSGFIQWVDSANARIGRSVAWLTLGMVLIYFLIVLLRYCFDFGSIAMQESVTYMHALVFMGAAAYTLQTDGHVRVDIFYSRWSVERRALIDLLGSLLLLLPFAGALLIFSWGYVEAAWGQRETSAEPGGLPWVYLLKTMILVMSVQLILQALSQMAKAIHDLRGNA